HCNRLAKIGILLLRRHLAKRLRRQRLIRLGKALTFERRKQLIHLRRARRIRPSKAKKQPPAAACRQQNHPTASRRHNDCNQLAPRHFLTFHRVLVPARKPAGNQRKLILFLSRYCGASLKTNSTTSSPVTVLMSWCMLMTRLFVASSIIDSTSGRAVSIRCVRTCFS